MSVSQDRSTIAARRQHMARLPHRLYFSDLFTFRCKGVHGIVRATMHLDLDPTSFVLGVLSGVAIVGALLVAAVLVVHWIAKQGDST